METLHRDGYQILDDVGANELRSIIDLLGISILETAVKIDNKKKSQVFSAEPMEWHQDSPEARWIAWHCVNPGNSESEPTEILDASLILKQFTEKQIAPLKELRTRVRSVMEAEYSAPFWSSNGSIHYCPWLLDSPSNDQLTALEQFKTCLYQGDHQKISIKWTANRTLIIDNHRFLHKRPSLDQASPRHLIRFWIKEQHAS